MKRICILCFTGLLFFTACENTNSSTVGTYEKEETSESSQKSEGGSHGGQVKQSTEHATEHGDADTTLKTSGAASPDGSGVEVETGAPVAADTTKSKAIPKH